MWVEERGHKLKQIRANARPRVLDRVRAGFICLGLALVLFASMGWLTSMSAVVGVAACVGLYAIVSGIDARHKKGGSTPKTDHDGDGC